MEFLQKQYTGQNPEVYRVNEIIPRIVKSGLVRNIFVCIIPGPLSMDFVRELGKEIIQVIDLSQIFAHLAVHSLANKASAIKIIPNRDFHIKSRVRSSPLRLSLVLSLQFTIGDIILYSMCGIILHEISNDLILNTTYWVDHYFMVADNTQVL